MLQENSVKPVNWEGHLGGRFRGVLFSYGVHTLLSKCFRTLMYHISLNVSFVLRYFQIIMQGSAWYLEVLGFSWIIYSDKDLGLNICL